MDSVRSEFLFMPTNIPSFLQNPGITVSIFLAGAVILLIWSRDNSDTPHANPPSWARPAAVLQLDAMKSGLDILYGAKKRFPGKIFRMVNNSGEFTVFPPQFANIIRNESGLSFARTVQHDFHSHIPGFYPFDIIDHPGQVLQNVARKPLTKLLNTVTEPLASESAFATAVVLGNPTEWRDTLILDSMLDLIARLSSRVFLGEDLCRNEDWLKVTKEYTVDAFKAAQKVVLLPSGLRYLLALFMTDRKIVNDEARRAQTLMKPVIEKRRAIKEQARAAGEPIPKFNDAIEWAEAECKGQSYDPAYFQLMLSVAAIHTTSDLLSKIMLLLCTNAELIIPIREEMARVLKADGWSKTSLYNMKLVDSTMKEAQRMMPNERVAMHRIATKDVHLKEENITIRKGQRVAIDATRVSDPTLYENPEKFDIYRWMRMREVPEISSKAHFVSTSADHLGFGHGMHACPGRFFAANEVKIALCYLLLNYDWQLAPGTTATQLSFGTSHLVDPKSTLRYKKREAEVDLEALKCE